MLPALTVPRAAINFVTVLIPAAVHPESPGTAATPDTMGHHTGSSDSMISAAACVARGTGVPVASNTTTAVPVGTVSIKVDVAAGVEVASADVADSLSVGTAVAAEVADSLSVGTEVLSDVTEVAADVADSLSEGSEVLAGTTDVSAEVAEVSVDDTEVPEEAGDVGATGVLSSARTIMGCNALITMTSKVRLVNKMK